VENKQLHHPAVKLLDHALEEIAVEPANYGSKLCSNARKVQKFLPMLEMADPGMCDLLGKLIAEVVGLSKEEVKHEEGG